MRRCGEYGREFAASLGSTEDLNYLQAHIDEIYELHEQMTKRIGGLHSAVAAHTLALEKLTKSRTWQRLGLDLLAQTIRRMQART